MAGDAAAKRFRPPVLVSLAFQRTAPSPASTHCLKRLGAGAQARPAGHQAAEPAAADQIVAVAEFLIIQICTSARFICRSETFPALRQSQSARFRATDGRRAWHRCKEVRRSVAEERWAHSCRALLPDDRRLQWPGGRAVRTSRAWSVRRWTKTAYLRRRLRAAGCPSSRAGLGGLACVPSAPPIRGRRSRFPGMTRSRPAPLPDRRG